MIYFLYSTMQFLVCLPFQWIKNMHFLHSDTEDTEFDRGNHCHSSDSPHQCLGKGRFFRYIYLQETAQLVVFPEL